MPMLQVPDQSHGLYIDSQEQFADGIHKATSDLCDISTCFFSLVQCCCSLVERSPCNTPKFKAGYVRLEDINVLSEQANQF